MGIATHGSFFGMIFRILLPGDEIESFSISSQNFPIEIDRKH